jgi:hypothetical protein
MLLKMSKKRQRNIVGKSLDICHPFELQNDSFKFRNIRSGAVIAWFCVLLMVSILALILNYLKYFYDLMVGLGQQCVHQLFITVQFKLIGTFIHHSIGMCIMRQFFAVLRSFFRSSLLYTFSCHSSPPTILPSFLTSSCHLPLSLVQIDI